MNELARETIPFVKGDQLYSATGLTARQREIRDYALNDLEAFIRLVAPYQLLAHCHIELCDWIKKHYYEHKLVLWPRDHGKSRMAAFYTAWEICRDPSVTIIYGSATAEKAEEQLRFVKTILESKQVFKYFPNLINMEEGKRASWNKTYIIVDHPRRAENGVVDSTVMTCGLEKTITGKHCNRLVLDDIVVPENNTEQGRKDVNAWLAQAASIMSADSVIFDVGTRYHPRDAHQMAMDMTYDDPIESEDGEILFEPRSMFSVNIANVEEDEEFLWPRSQRRDGKWFGFNRQILAKKRAVYEAAGEITQFYAQYYNDPNDKSTAPISRDLFKYYEREDLEFTVGMWSVEGRPCYMYAAVDLAATTKNQSDFTALTVGAIDTLGNRYLIAAVQMKTDKMSVIDNEIQRLYDSYQFKKLRIEAVGGFKLVAKDLEDRLHASGIRIPVDIYTPPSREGKEMRVNGILEPLYQSGAVYHYRSGNAQILEDQLCSANPMNDDLKDSWAMCCELMEPIRHIRKKKPRNVIQFHPRFGGVAL